MRKCGKFEKIKPKIELRGEETDKPMACNHYGYIAARTIVARKIAIIAITYCVRLYDHLYWSISNNKPIKS